MTVPVRATPWCSSPVQLTCRELLAGAGARAAALLLDRGALSAHAPTKPAPTPQVTTVVFANTTVANPDLGL